MRCEERMVPGSEQGELFVRIWHAEETPKALVVLAHGHGEHSGRYHRVASTLVPQGFTVAAFDHRGHGRSGGRRGHLSSIDAPLRDTVAVLDDVRRRLAMPSLPVFLYGHSMGGNIALNCALRHDPDIGGIVLTSPWLRLAFKPPAVKEWAGRALASVWPALPMKTGLKEKDLHRSDKRSVPPMTSDPLCHTTITPRAYLSIQRGGEWALRHAGELKVPMLLLHGTEDRITSYRASEELAAVLGEQCEWRPWSGGLHELHNDVDGKMAVQAIADWFHRQISRINA